MNTIPDSNGPSYPTLQAAWHKMISRSRASDRAIALLLCRAAFQERNGGRFTNIRSLTEAELTERLGVSSRQQLRLMQNSPLWRWVGNDLELFFYGSPGEEGQPTPSTYGKRRARHARRKREREHREQGRRRLGSLPYIIPDDEAWLAADEDEDD